MKSNNEKTALSYERARKKVAAIKSFYGHLTVYIIVNAFVLFTSGNYLFTMFSKEALGNPKFLNWIDWNVYGTAIVWGFVLIIHALSAFNSNPFFGKNWEEKQLRKYMDSDNSNHKKYQ